jgi:hypothetical protein
MINYVIRYYLKIVCFSIFSALFIFLNTANDLNAKPQLPIDMQFSFANKIVNYEVITLGSIHNKVMPVSFSVNHQLNINNTQIKVLVPEGVTVVNGKTEWNGNLGKNKEKILNFDLVFHKSGEYRIIGDVMFKDKNNKTLGASSTLYIIVSDKETKISMRIFSDIKRIGLKKEIETRKIKEIKSLRKDDPLRKEIEDLNRQKSIRE